MDTGEKYKEKFCNVYFEGFSTYIEQQNKILHNCGRKLRLLGAEGKNISKSSVILNNKVVELKHQFEEAGCSLFYKYLPKYGVGTSSVVGDAILSNLQELYRESAMKLDNLVVTIDEVTSNRANRFYKTDNSGIKRLYKKVYNWYYSTDKNAELLALTELEEEKLDKAIEAYESSCSRISEYSLENDLAPAVAEKLAKIKSLSSDGSNNRTQSAFESIDESVVDEIKKLGYEHVIPNISRALGAKYKEMESKKRYTPNDIFGKLSEDDFKYAQDAYKSVLKSYQNSTQDHTNSVDNERNITR